MDRPTVWGFRANQPVSWYTRRLEDGNQHCLYCGALVGVGATIASDKEHVVGRNFVPPGSLQGTDFNFIFRACKRCNRRKANAERHVSTISLLTSPARITDSSANEHAVRKATNDYHPTHKGKRVKDASETMSFRSDRGALNMEFEFKGPPQMDDQLAALVACNQVQALFSLTASEDPRSAATTHLLPASQWKPLGSFTHSDWGNCQLSEVSKRVSNWPILARFDTAGGFFRFISRQLDTDDCDWFWAIEWNKSVRVAGVVSASTENIALFQDLPEPERVWLSETTSMRRHTPISQADDGLFPILTG